MYHTPKISTEPTHQNKLSKTVINKKIFLHNLIFLKANNFQKESLVAFLISYGKKYEETFGCIFDHWSSCTSVYMPNLSFKP